MTTQYGVEHMRSPPTVICLLPFPHHVQLFACVPCLLLEVCRLHRVPGAGGRGEQEPNQMLWPELGFRLWGSSRRWPAEQRTSPPLHHRCFYPTCLLCLRTASRAAWCTLAAREQGCRDPSEWAGGSQALQKTGCWTKRLWGLGSILHMLAFYSERGEGLRAVVLWSSERGVL